MPKRSKSARLRRVDPTRRPTDAFDAMTPDADARTRETDGRTVDRSVVVWERFAMRVVDGASRVARARASRAMTVTPDI